MGNICPKMSENKKRVPKNGHSLFCFFLPDEVGNWCKSKKFLENEIKKIGKINRF